MSEFHNSHAWTKARNAIFKRDNGLCVNPFGIHTNKGMITQNGNPTQAQVVHHIIPIEIDRTKALRADNLVSLCEECHSIAHKLLLSKEGKIIYRNAFKLADDITLTPKDKNAPQQDFFMRKECVRLPNGKVKCARTGKIKETFCGVCKKKSVPKCPKFDKALL